MIRTYGIDTWSWKYWAVRTFLVRPMIKAYYRKIQVNNAQRIPGNEPVIIAPNHQNALFDALAIVYTLKPQTVFLARSDVFGNSLVNRILGFLKIMPVYRIRDGMDQLQKNDEIFDVTMTILRNKFNPLCLFPEGNHGDKRRIRPLVKGIFRIAFMAQEEYGNNPGVKIIPAGIDYEHYRKFRKNWFVNIGEPIEVSEYYDVYKENQAQGFNALRDRLSEEIKKVMVHIETEEYYDLYLYVKDFYNKPVKKKLKLKGRRLKNKFEADKYIIQKLDERLEEKEKSIHELNRNIQRLRKNLETLKLRSWLFKKESLRLLKVFILLLAQLVLLPLFILGVFNNWPHFFIPPMLVKKIKDKQFHSTIKWGIGVPIMLLYYMILGIMALVFLPGLYALFYIVLMPLSGLFAFNYYIVWLKNRGRLRSVFYRMTGNKKFAETSDYYKNVVQQLNNILQL